MLRAIKRIFIFFLLATSVGVPLRLGMATSPLKITSFNWDSALKGLYKLNENMAQIKTPAIDIKVASLEMAPLPINNRILNQGKKRRKRENFRRPAFPVEMILIPEEKVKPRKPFKPLEEIQEKDFFVEEVSFSQSSLLKEEEIVERKKKETQPHEIKGLNNDELIEHHGFSVETPVVVAWSDYFQKLDLKTKLAKLDREEGERKSLLLLAKNSSTTKNKFREVYQEKETEPLLQTEIPHEVKEEVRKGNDDNNHKNGLLGRREENQLVFYDYNENDDNNSNNVAKAEVDGPLNPQEERHKVQEQSIKLIQASQQRRESPHSIKSISQNPISPVVRKAIEREMGKAVKISFASPQSRGGTSVIPQKRKRSDDYPLSVSSQENHGFLSKSGNDETLSTIRAREINLNGQGGEKVFQFQFIPDYDNNEVIDDGPEGNILLESKLNNSRSFMGGTLLKQGLMRTRVEISLGGRGRDLTVPMITRESMDRFIDDHGMAEEGGFLLVDLGYDLNDVDISGKYQHRVFINEDFKVVDIEKSYRYILYSGIQAGNIIVRYLLSNGQEAQKIAHIVTDEILFETGHIGFPVLEKISLVEKATLDSEVSALDIAQNNIRLFNTNISLKKEGFNGFKGKFPPLPSGSRHFVELSHLEGRLFVGLTPRRHQQLEIPGEDFITQIFNAHRIDELNGRCIVQVNINKKMKSFRVDGNSNEGGISFRKTFLEENGVWAEELTKRVNKVFLVGEMPGVFNIKIGYQDDTVDYLRSFCSDSTYLIESL